MQAHTFVSPCCAISWPYRSLHPPKQIWGELSLCFAHSLSARLPGILITLFCGLLAACVVYGDICGRSLSDWPSVTLIVVLTVAFALSRDNWQEMVTEEIKTLFRKANRKVDKRLWMRCERRESRTEASVLMRQSAGRERPRTPSSLWMWLKADFFKRIVSPLANLPAASEAEHDGANVMRVVQLAAYMLDLLWAAERR